MLKKGPRSRKMGALVMAAMATATGMPISRQSHGEIPFLP